MPRLMPRYYPDTVTRKQPGSTSIQRVQSGFLPGIFREQPNRTIDFNRLELSHLTDQHIASQEK